MLTEHNGLIFFNNIIQIESLPIIEFKTLYKYKRGDATRDINRAYQQSNTRRILEALSREPLYLRYANYLYSFFFFLFIFILSEFSPTLIEKVHETLMWLKKVGHYPAILNKHLTFLFGSPKFMTY